jgi:uncharacterized protein (DUF58 family)
MKLRNIYPGEWESIYLGEGIEFAAIKQYEPGDNLRDLDLHTLVQSGEEDIIQRVVGRQMRAYLWVDVSGSMRSFEEMLFPQKPRIRDVAIGLLMFSACNAYSPVGFCAFNDAVNKFFPAKSGEKHCVDIMDWIGNHEPTVSTAPVNVEGAISFLLERAFPESFVFCVSDFKDPVFEEAFSSLLRPVVQKFDFIPVVIRDPLEKDATLKRSVRLSVRDCEGRRRDEVHLTPRKLKEIQEISASHLRHLEWNFQKVGLDHVVLDSPSILECSQTLASFFQARRRARG